MQSKMSLNVNQLISHLKKFKWNKKDLSGTSLCPFHNDSNPSFGISLPLNAYHCFSCNASGNLNKLCEHLNIEPLFHSTLNKTAGSKNLKGVLKQEYKNISQEGAYSIISTKKDAIIDPTLNEARYKYKNAYLDLRIMEDYLKDKFHCRYDTETESIIFPIYNMEGLIVGNYRRFNNKKTKHKIKGKFSKGFQISYKNLYNLNNYAGQKTILITEGIIDCITTYGNLHEEDLLKHILPISCYSVTNLNKKHIQLLRNIGAENIILFFDNDQAGIIGIESFNEKVWKYLKNKLGYKLFSVFKPNFNFYPKDIKDPDGLLPEQTKLLLQNLEVL